MQMYNGTNYHVLPFYAPIALNATNPRLIAVGAGAVGAAATVYTSPDRAQSFIPLPGAGAGAPTNSVSALVYGGFAGTTPMQDVLYVGDQSFEAVPHGQLFVQSTSAGGLNFVAAYKGGSPTAIALKPTDWQTAYITDDTHVYRTTDGGGHVADITGNLLAGLGVAHVFSVVIIPGGRADGIAVGTDIGVFLTTTDSLRCAGLGDNCATVWTAFGSTLPRTNAYSLAYDAGTDTLVVGTLGRSAFKLDNASSVVFGENRLFGAAHADQPVEVEVRLQQTVTGFQAVSTLGATAGNFIVTFDGKTTTTLAVDSPAAAIQTAIRGLASVGAVAVTVDRTGNQLTIDLVSLDPTKLTVQEVILGTVRRTTSPAEFAAALQSQMNDVLHAAGETGVNTAVSLSAGMLQIGQTGAYQLQVRFPSPVVAQLGGGKISLTAPAVTYTAGPKAAAINRDQRVGVTVGLSGPGFVSATAVVDGTASLSSGTYPYVVTAVMADSAESNTSAAVTATLTATGKVVLRWNVVQGAVSYNVYRLRSGFFSLSHQFTGITATTFTDVGATGTTSVALDGPGNVIATPALDATANLAAGIYHYVVSANVPGGETKASTDVWAILLGKGKVALHWDTVGAATSYNVYRLRSGGFLSVTRLFDSISAIVLFPPTANYRQDPAFQELGLTTSPTPASFADGTTPDIEFTLHVSTATSGGPVDVRVYLPGADTYSTLDDLVAALQDAVNLALDSSTLGSHDANADGVPDILVCRPNDDPNATGVAACQGTGNRILFRGESGVVSSLSIDVPADLDQGDNAGTPNGAVTLLGYSASGGETHHARASRFFLDNVKLSGTFDLVVQNLAVTANVGFLAVKASAEGTLPGGRLLSLTIGVELRNPLAHTGDADQNHLDLLVLANTVGDGHFIYDSNNAGGSNEHPGTGFFFGSLSGGLGAKLRLAPDGVLSGLADTLNATLTITATSPNWFHSLPTPQFQFQGPDFNAILDRFKHLDFATIVQALQMIVGLVRSLDGSGGSPAIASFLAKPLPLVNRSIAQLLDVASDVANKINAVLQNPAGAIQRLNNILANALGMTVPGIAVSDSVSDGGTPGTATQNEVQHLAVNHVTGGTYTLNYSYLLKPQGLQVSASGAGSLAGAYFYEVTATVGGNETVASPEVSITVVGPTGLSLSWQPVDGATSYRVYRGTSSGGENAYFTSATPTFSDSGAAGTAGAPPASDSNSTVTLSQTTAPLAYNADAAAIQAALEALGAIGPGNVSVSGSAGSFLVTFQGNLGMQAIPLLTADASGLAYVPSGQLPLLVYDPTTGELDFNFDIGTSVQISRPFSLDLSNLGLPDAFANVVKSLVGVGASGNLSVTASAALHVRLGLDLNIDSISTTTPGTSTQSDVQSLVTKATGGSFNLIFPFDLAPQNLVATAVAADPMALTTMLAGARYYVVTAMLGSHETTASSEASTTVDAGGKVNLKWAAVTGASGGYRVYFGTTSGGEGAYLSASTNSLTDDGSSSGTTATPPPAATADNQTTADINWNADSTAMAADIQAKLEALANVGTGNVAVTSSTGVVTSPGSPQTFTITFQGALAHTDVPQLQIDDGNLSGKRVFFIKTGPTGTHLHFDARASVANLNFVARIGPFGLFVKNGSASIGANLELSLIDFNANGRLVLVGFGGDGVSSDLGSLGSFVGAGSICLTGTATAPAPACPTGPTMFAVVSLPLFVGTESFQLPINDPVFSGMGVAGGNVLGVKIGIDGSVLFSDPASIFIFSSTSACPSCGFTPPDWSNFSPNLPSIFALLADPSTVVDGLDFFLQTLQEALSGQIFGVKLPLLGKLLDNNPLSNAISDFRSNFLKPLANTLRDNNLGLDFVVQKVQQLAFEVFSNQLGILLPSGTETVPTASDIQFKMLKNDPVTHRPRAVAANIFDAQQAEFDFPLGKTYTFTAAPISIDLGIPALGLDARFVPQITISFGLNFGFGVDLNSGFYFVSGHNRVGGIDSITPALTLATTVTFSDVSCPTGSVNRAQIDGRLLFLALHLQDGIDLNGDGSVSVQCAGNNPNPVVNPQTQEISTLFFNGSVNLGDPNNDGMLTFSEITSSSLSEIIQPTLAGGALLRADASIDFSVLGGDFANILPKLSTKILVDFVLSWSAASGLSVGPPQVVFGDITLDLGSFISNFAGPILNKIGDILQPLAWLIGPNGFLNMRIPILSDLAGHTITGKDLVVLFDPTDGPKIVAFLDFVQTLYHLIDLVHKAASEGNVMLNFGDLVLSHANPGAAVANFAKWSFFDNPIQGIGLPMPGPGVAGADISQLGNLGNIAIPDSLPGPSTEGNMGSSTSDFTSGVQKKGSIDFPILKASNVINLLLGKPATLVEVTLPTFGFNFFYRQSFPIIGPLVGTFGGGIGATISLRLGYDTQGLTDFLASHNAASLLEGFFFDTKDSLGNLLPVAMLHAEIAVGAALDLGLIEAGVEGGISADIFFNWDDLNKDGKVRLDEMKANILANGGDPLAVFDITGEIDLFLRAYVTINLFFTSFTETFEFARLKLFSFSVPFKRPAFLGTQNGGALTLAIGPSSKNRIQGNLDDISESIHVASDGGSGRVKVWSDQFNRSEANAQSFSGVTSIIGSAGAGDDNIDLSGLNDNTISIVIHGGDGNDTISGPRQSKCDADTGFCAQLFGEGGNDTLTSNSGQKDMLDGGDGNDTLIGSTDSASTSILQGGAGDGNDTINGGAGAETYVGQHSASVVVINNPDNHGHGILDLSGRTENITFVAADNKLIAGWGAPDPSSTPFLNGPTVTVTNFAHMIEVTNLSSIGTIRGGSGADTFRIYQTGGTFTTQLDGQGGNDTYDFLNVGHGSSIKAEVNDTGHPWDSGNQIVIDGSSMADNIAVTSSQVCAPDCGSPTQLVTYDAPAADATVISLQVNGNGGNDTIKVLSTSPTVPVRVDGGGGSDVITVGGGTLQGIAGISRPGLDTPLGVGPLVVVGGGGINTLIVDDTADTVARNGFLTAFLESRTVAPRGVEVGVISGLGMQLYADGATFLGAGAAGDGRIEFEGIEAVSVKLGKGDDTFSVGGDSLLGSGAGKLPLTRQEHILHFIQTPTAMLSVSGGDGNDTIRVLSTNQVDRTQLDAGAGLLQVTTAVQGVTGTTSAVQHLDIQGQMTDTTNQYTLQYLTEVTAPVAFSAGASAVQSALQGLASLGTKVTVAAAHGGGFDFTFANSLGRVANLVARLAAPLVRVVTTQEGVAGSLPEIEHLSISGLTAGEGYFTLKYHFQETNALTFGISAADLTTALQNAFTVVGAAISASGSPGSFDITFDSSLGNVDQITPALVPLLVAGGAGDDRLRVQSAYEDLFWAGGAGNDSADLNRNPITLAAFNPTDVVAHVGIRETHLGGASQDETQLITLTNVTGGTFNLAFGGNPTAPIDWDAPASAVTDALAALPGIGKDSTGAPNVGVIQTGNTYLVEFLGDLKDKTEPLLTSNVVVSTTQAGGPGVDAIQHIALQSVTSGAFNLDYTYDVQPLGLAADPNHVGTLLPGTYYYVVTAVVGTKETLASAEVFKVVGSNGAIQLDWGVVPDALSYHVYRGTTAGGENLRFAAAGPTFLDDNSATGTAATPPTTTTVHAIQTTIPISFNASPSAVKAALEVLPTIGKGNVLVTGSGGSYAVEFTGTLGNRAIALMTGSVDALRSNGIHAIVTLDGQQGSDNYDINLIGGRTNSLINVFDTGKKTEGSDALTVTGTDYPDIFLLRASTADNGLAFIALINGPTPLTPLATDPVERVNYTSNLESITIDGGNGDDQFYIDDTRARITINGDQGNDFFQIGQLYKSRRTPDLAGIAPEDVFATIDTTQGWLSNGISKPMTINGGIGDDSFIVFHNLDTLDLNGDAGNDSFIVQAFALAGSQEDHRALTDLSGGAGADLIKYAVNAPVNIDGGDGFDTVVVIGTEFGDDFVITPNGVFGAGLNVNFVNIEALEIDGGAGNDRFQLDDHGDRRPRLRLLQCSGADAGQRRHQQRPDRPQRNPDPRGPELARRFGLQRDQGRRHLGQRGRQRHAGGRGRADGRVLAGGPGRRHPLLERRPDA